MDQWGNISRDPSSSNLICLHSPSSMSMPSLTSSNCQNRKHHQNHQHLQNIRIENIIKVFNIFKIIKIFKIIRIINIFFLPIAWIELCPKFQSIFAVVKAPTEAEKRHYLIIYIHLFFIYNIFWQCWFLTLSYQQPRV